MRTALVVGGTGPSGPHIVCGLVDRGFKVSMLHSGRHEDESIPDCVEHIHTDAFDPACLHGALDHREFDLAVITYGRLRDIARVLRGRVGRFISVGGVPANRGFDDPAAMPWGALPMPVRETGPKASGAGNAKIAHIVQTEEAVFANHPEAFHFRFPVIYGPRQLMAREWMVVRRVLDQRSTIILPDGGATLMSTAYSENAAHAILCAVDQPNEAKCGIYNVADEWTPTLRQWVTILADALGHRFTFVDIPFALASVAWPLLSMNDPFHRVFPMDKAMYELGYRDIVPVDEALARTARWLVANPPAGGGAIDTGDRFDYAGEDRLIAQWQALVTEIAPLARAVEARGTLGERYRPDFDAVNQHRAGEWALLSKRG
jgi:nucleoside-diphosphate-sugar epimerase